MKLLLTFAYAAAALLAAHEIEPAGAAPAGLDPAIAGLLQKDGVRVKNGPKVHMELWFRSSTPSGAKTTEPNVTLTNVPHGSLLGVVRIPERGADRRGQTLQPGLYTMRLSFFPENGDHQGVAPQRDFLVLSPVAEDKDPNATPGFDPLMNMSRKASGTPHPAVLSMWKAEAGAVPGIALQGEHDWVLQTKIGDIPVAVIVDGKADH